MCNFTYVVETNQFQTITTDEYYSIPWENEEIPVDVSIQREFSGKSPSQGITIRAPFAPVTNVRHTNLDKGRTRISWSKPDTNSKIDKYIVIWDNKMEEVPSGTTSLTDSFTKCVDNEIFIAVKYPGQSSPNVSYIFQYVVGEYPSAGKINLRSIHSHNRCTLLNYPFSRTRTSQIHSAPIRESVLQTVLGCPFREHTVL